MWLHCGFTSKPSTVWCLQRKLTKFFFMEKTAYTRLALLNRGKKECRWHCNEYELLLRKHRIAPHVNETTQNIRNWISFCLICHCFFCHRSVHLVTGSFLGFYAIAASQYQLSGREIDSNSDAMTSICAVFLWQLAIIHENQTRKNGKLFPPTFFLVVDTKSAVCVQTKHILPHVLNW